MSLRAFHILFIFLSAVLCVALGLWAVQRYREGSGEGLVLGILAAAGAALLVPYLAWFMRKYRGAA